MFISLEEAFDYIKNNKFGISSISRPDDHTVVYIMAKIKDKLDNLKWCRDCFVFYQTGIEIPEELGKLHVFCEAEDASQAFAAYVEEAFGNHEKEERNRKYTTSKDDVTFGENVIVGEGTYIESGAFIGHDVVIGKNCCIKTGAILKNCVVGDNCTIYERAFIGNTPYNFHDEDGVLKRTLAIGKVFLEDYVDIGAYTIVDRGTTTNTKICYGTKVDSNVYIGHDVYIGKNIEITAGSLVGGFSEIEDDSKVYTANIMKRTRVARSAVIGFNSGVISDIKQEVEVFGYPARVIKGLNK